MSRKTILTILAILIIPILAFWGLSSIQSSEAVAQSDGIPQIIKFSSSMCLECKQVEKIFNEIMPKYKDNVEYISIIVDSKKDMDNELIKKHNVQLVPTVIMIDSNGKVCKRFEGAVSKDEYMKAIEGLK